jgi:dUTP pyrophosphatase
MKIKAVRNLKEYGINLQERLTYQFKEDSCFDLIACVPFWLPAFGNKWEAIPTGIAIELPTNCMGLILPRSGLAKIMGIDVLAGVIDTGYRGEIYANIINHGPKGQEFNIGERIAQLAIIPYFRPSFEWVPELTPTDRGGKGHGSTGR